MKSTCTISLALTLSILCAAPLAEEAKEANLTVG